MSFRPEEFNPLGFGCFEEIAGIPKYGTLRLRDFRFKKGNRIVHDDFGKGVVFKTEARWAWGGWEFYVFFKLDCFDHISQMVQALWDPSTRVSGHFAHLQHATGN